MTEIEKTTPRPWSIQDGWPRYIYGADGRCIAETDRGKSDVCNYDAALIVRAVNSHDQLERAARLLVQAFENKDFLNLVDEAFREAKEAIAGLDGEKKGA